MFQASRGSSARGSAPALARVHVPQDSTARGSSTGQCIRENNEAMVRSHVMVESCLSSILRQICGCPTIMVPKGFLQ